MRAHPNAQRSARGSCAAPGCSQDRAHQTGVQQTLRHRCVRTSFCGTEHAYGAGGWRNNGTAVDPDQLRDDVAGHARREIARVANCLTRIEVHPGSLAERG